MFGVFGPEARADPEKPALLVTQSVLTQTLDKSVQNLGAPNPTFGPS